MTFHQQQVAQLRTTYAERSEELMREVRVRLGQAMMCEQRGEHELAERYGAVAGNKAAIALNIASKIISIEERMTS